MAVVGLVAVVVTAPRASGQETCSCTDKDPATAVELQITAATPKDHSRIGPEQESLVVDIRGEQTVLVGDAPELLAGVDLAEVPVLMLALEDASGTDECSAAPPPAGADLSVTGQVYMEETGPVVWTGPCQGTLTIAAAAAPVEATHEDTWGRGLAISGGVLAGLAVLCLAAALITRRHD
jgi:hypothetical protein